MIDKHNTAAVLHNDSAYLGKYRKTYIPHVAPGFWEKSYFHIGPTCTVRRLPHNGTPW